jgi:hypothetical protein
MHKPLALVGLLALILFSAGASAQTSCAFCDSSFTSTNNLTINGTAYDNVDSGWIDANGNHTGGNTNYATGVDSGVPVSDYFSFELANLAGTVTSASLNVDAYDLTANGPYAIYATTLTPDEVNSGNSFNSVAYYDALTSGQEIGTIDLVTADDNSTVTIDLNAAGLAWLQANEGDGIVVGGVYNQAVTPEPSSLLLLGSGIVGLAVMIRRKIAKSL